MREKQIWFLVGSQHLYGEGPLKIVADDGREIAESLNAQEKIPCSIIFKALVTTSDQILDACREANNDPACVGIMTWMHTFSPAKMWIAGLTELKKPLLHLHTQYNRDIPWDTIDMDFMNLNQSAHGDREFGFICSRLRLNRKVVAGYWKDETVISEIASWARAAAAWDFSKNLKVARFGDNMRDVAVTEGDKVEARIKLGWTVNGYGTADLVDVYNEVSDADVKALLAGYEKEYAMNTTDLDAVYEQAKIEIAMRRFLENGGYKAFTTTFEDLHGLKQLPGLAVQRLTGDGYGFGGEGDWKTSALSSVMKYMASGLKGGTGFMEDYTYNLEPGKEAILGAHMLEVDPSFAAEKPAIEVHELGIGGKEPPARMVFKANTGKAVIATVLDMGNRFRMLVNTATLIDIENDMPKLPVARVLWKPEPSLKVSSSAWIYAGGAHHTCLSTSLTVEDLRNFAMMADIEFVLIDENTELNAFVNELRAGDVIWK